MSARGATPSPKVDEAVGDVHAGTFQLTSPIDVVSFVSAGGQLDEDGNLFAVLRCFEQGVNHRGLRPDAIERGLDGEHIGVAGGGSDQVDDRESVNLEIIISLAGRLHEFAALFVVRDAEDGLVHHQRNENAVIAVRNDQVRPGNLGNEVLKVLDRPRGQQIRRMPRAVHRGPDVLDGYHVRANLRREKQHGMAAAIEPFGKSGQLVNVFLIANRVRGRPIVTREEWNRICPHDRARAVRWSRPWFRQAETIHKIRQNGMAALYSHARSDQRQR